MRLAAERNALYSGGKSVVEFVQIGGANMSEERQFSTDGVVYIKSGERDSASFCSLNSFI